jgi:tetratricopeptide (TPR) repeat protein
MKAHCRLVVLSALVALTLFAFSPTAEGQGGSGPAAQSPTRDRKPPQKDDPLKSYLPREASIRLPQRYAIRGGIEASAPSHLSKGETEYRAGRNAAALPELKAAVKESPDSYDSHYLLALTLTETGDLKEAIEEFKKALALATNDDSKIVAYYNLANAYFDLGDYQNAADAYQNSLRIDGTLSKVHNNLGLALVGMNRTREAGAEFKQAVDLKPQYAEAHYNLGVAYLKLGKKSEAEQQSQALATINTELAAKLKKLINP